MRHSLIIALTAVLFSSWLRGADYRHEASGTLFPDEVGALRRGPERKYEAEPGQGGTAVPYLGDNTAVTVLIRNLTPGVMPTARGSLYDALDGIKEFESSGRYSNVKITHIDEGKLPAGWRGAVFTAKSEGQFVVSFIYCSVRPGFLFKVRVTTGNPAFEKLMPDLDSLLKVIDGPAGPTPKSR